MQADASFLLLTPCCALVALLYPCNTWSFQPLNMDMLARCMPCCVLLQRTLAVYELLTGRTPHRARLCTKGLKVTVLQTPNQHRQADLAQLR